MADGTARKAEGNNRTAEEMESFLITSPDTNEDRDSPREMGFYERFLASSVKDLTSAGFYRALLGELIGDLFLVFVGCSSVAYDTDPQNSDYLNHVRISLAFGLSVATMVWILADVSGGHINPAVTAGMLITRKISLVRFLLYIVAQCVGAILGSLAQRYLTCHGVTNTAQCVAGANTLNPGLTAGQGMAVEFLVTFVLVSTVFATCDKSRTDLGGSGPLAIGLSVTMCHLGFIKVSGSSMNPARTFGPAVVYGIWKDHWVYWIGPLLGGVVAGLIYEFVIAGNAGVSKLISWLKDSRYEREEVNRDPYELEQSQSKA